MKMPTYNRDITLVDYPIPDITEVEDQVIADATNNPEYFNDYRGIVSGECFESEPKRVVWERLSELQESGEEISLLTLRGIAPQSLVNSIAAKEVSTPMQGITNCRTLTKVHQDREIYRMSLDILVKASCHNLSLHDANIIDKMRTCLESATTTNYRQWEVDITQAQPEPDPIIERDGKVFLSRSNLCVLVGRPKAGKTTMLSSIAATACTGLTSLGFSSKGGFKTVWFDTEQSKDDCARAWQRVYKAANLPLEKRDDLIFFSLIDAPVKERLNIITSCIRDNLPDLVIIDGIADLTLNPNDIEESRSLVTEIRRLNSVYQCGVVTVLHVNWRDEKARGHLGTELQGKAENITLLVHTAGMDSPIKVTPQLTRKAPYDEFTFEYNKIIGEHVLVACTSTPPAISILLDSMTQGKFYKHKDLISIMGEKGVGESNSKKYVSEAVKKGFIHKYEDGYVLEDGDLPE